MQPALLALTQTPPISASPVMASAPRALVLHRQNAPPAIYLPLWSEPLTTVTLPAPPPSTTSMGAGSVSPAMSTVTGVSAPQIPSVLIVRPALSLWEAGTAMPPVPLICTWSVGRIYAQVRGAHLDCNPYCATCSDSASTDCLSCDFSVAVQVLPTTC